MNSDFAKRMSEKLQAGIDKARAARMEDERRRLMSTVGQDVAQMLQPFLLEIASSAKANKDTLREAMSEALGTLNSREQKIDTAPIIGAIEAAFMGIQIPEPKVTVTMPEIKLPPIEMPDVKNMRGVMALLHNGGEVGFDNPLPVMMLGRDGKPVDFFSGMRQAIGGGGGGKADFFTIKDIRDSSGASIIDSATGAMKVTGSISVTTGNNSTQAIDSSGDPYSQANPLPVINVGGAAGTSVSLVNADGTYYDSANPLPVTFSAASVQPVSQVSGASWSISVSDIFATTAASTVVNPDNRVKVELPSFTQAISVTDIFATSATSTVVTPDNRVKVDGSGVTQPISGTVVVSSVTATIAAMHVDSSGVGYSGSNPVPVTWVSGAGVSTAVHITDSSGVAYSGSNPIPITVVSGAAATTNAVLTRRTNPTAVAADYVPLSADDLGRQLVRPVQVRDLIVTARASATGGSETTLLAASAGSYHDLIYVLAANNSDAACSIDIRAVTGGNIVMTLQLPANGTVGVAAPVPIPQDETGNNWTFDGPDETGRTITVTALFSREV